MKLIIFAIIGLLVFLIVFPSMADDYLIRPGDSLGLVVLGETDLTRHVIVDPQGNVSLPLVHEVNVAGMTVTQAAEKITTALKQYIKNPQVSLELIEPVKLEITVSGEVQRPGIYPIKSGGSVMDAITAAGGFTPKSDTAKLTVSHSGSAGPATTLNMNKFLMASDPSVNIPLLAGDTIFVPLMGIPPIGSIQVLGAVRSPGPFPLSDGMTAREAIAAAGGPTEVADFKSVKVRHEGSSDTVNIDFTNLFPGTPSNPLLKPGDVVFVSVQQVLGYFTIQGAVTKPDRYAIKDNPTNITDAIALAGGTTHAQLNKVSVVRMTNGVSQTLKVNVKDILQNGAANVPIRDGDTIYVPGGKSAPGTLGVLSVLGSLGWLIVH